jgi:large subunit ribosomal protein L10
MKASLSQAAALFQAPLAQAARTIEALRVKAEADPSVIGGAGAAAPAAEAAPVIEEVPAQADVAETTEDAVAETEETAADAVAAEVTDAPADAEAEVGETTEG